MSVLRMTATAGPDGVLHLNVPTGCEGEFEVTVVVVPKPTTNGTAPTTGAKTPGRNRLAPRVL